MSKAKFDSDGFEIVKSKNYSKNKPTKIPSKDSVLENENTIIDVDKVIRRINDAVEELKSSKYYEDLSASVSTIIQSRKLVEIVCFGLGHIGDCSISRHQLALLLCIKNLLSVTKVLVHDPIFTPDECKVLKQLNLEVIEENCEGSYLIPEKGLCLVYLPHCPKQLTNNFLWTNWSPNLKNCILICNSFTSLVENQPSRILLETVPYLYNIQPYTCEVTLENSFKYTDIFNDTSIHHFSQENFDKVASEFWLKGEKPQYENTEEFITNLLIKKLNI